MSILKSVMTESAWLGFVLRRRVKRRLLSVTRLFVRPSLPKNADGRVYLHLGCGDINSPEFVNVDVRPAPHVHYVREVSDLSIFPDRYADMVYACHLLEHIKSHDLDKVLWEWGRVLKPGGVLRLSVPDFDKLVAVYEACGRDVNSIKGPLLGRWDGYNPHWMIFTYRYLSDLLSRAGFVDIREWHAATVEHHDFEDWASRTITRNNREFQISLNVEGQKA